MPLSFLATFVEALILTMSSAACVDPREDPTFAETNSANDLVKSLVKKVKLTLSDRPQVREGLDIVPDQVSCTRESLTVSIDESTRDSEE